MHDQLNPPATALPVRPLPVGLFSMILGMSGLGYAWRTGAKLWPLPPVLAEAELLLTFAIWGALVLRYAHQWLRHPQLARGEFGDGALGGTAALPGIATLVLVPAMAAYSRPGAWVLAGAGIAWHLVFSLWHAGRLWMGRRDRADTTPALYLPSVAGNFTSAAALGVLGQPDWAWLFFGAGLFSWLALEPVIMHSVWHRDGLAPARRPLMGIQAAPPLVCAASLLLIDPAMTGQSVTVLLGYGLYQLALGLRLRGWLGGNGFARNWWAYTFGMTSALNCCLKLALAGSGPARLLAPPLMAAVTGFVAWLFLRTARGK